MLPDGIGTTARNASAFGFAKGHRSSEGLRDVLEMRDVNLSARTYSIAGELHLFGLIPSSFIKKKGWYVAECQKLGR